MIARRPSRTDTPAETVLLPSSDPTGEGRVVVENLWPEVDGGRTPVKRSLGEAVEVWVDILTDGHDKIAAELLHRGPGEEDWWRVPMTHRGNDRWSARFTPAVLGRHYFTVEAWRDPYASWRDEIVKKRDAGRDVTLEIVEGVEIAHTAARLARGADAMAFAPLINALDKADPAKKLKLLLSDEEGELIARNAERLALTSDTPAVEVIADRTAARFSAWYELFPRSASNDPKRHGTFDDVIARLPYVRDLGFDVLYFPPIHPIGTTNRKGRNNALTAGADDVGSVYAIGSEHGGHDAIHPELGSIEDFRRLVAAAHEHGLEIALDFAIQCSPDHPWIKEHPEWFDWRPDGTLKFAENPPKKYEDIVNVEFYEGGLPTLWHALRDVVLFWAREGVRIFRVDNPHTKPLPFWRWLIREVNEAHPDVIFLAEAFTRPKLMLALAKAGFQQSYTYFTWRNTKAELTQYMTELTSGAMAEVYRPNFFVNTPDINPLYLQTGGRAGFAARATLAATLSSVYGIYSGFELCEAAPLPGREEYLDSEKYELRARDYDAPGNIKDLIRALNAARADNPALHDFRNIRFLNVWNDNILAYIKLTEARDNAVMVLVNLDPHSRQEADYEVPLWEFGLPDSGSIIVEDLIKGGRFTLTGKTHRIVLAPTGDQVMVWKLIPPGAA